MGIYSQNNNDNKASFWYNRYQSRDNSNIGNEIKKEVKNKGNHSPQFSPVVETEVI